MRIDHRDTLEKINKFKGMRARMTRYSTGCAGDEPGHPIDEIVTILGFCNHRQNGLSNHIQVLRDTACCYWWVEVELDPDRNY